MRKRFADRRRRGRLPQPGYPVPACRREHLAIRAKGYGIDSARLLQNRPQRAELAGPASQLGADGPLEVYFFGGGNLETVCQQEHRGADVPFFMQSPALMLGQVSQRPLGLAALSSGLFQRGDGLHVFSAEALRITRGGDGKTD